MRKAAARPRQAPPLPARDFIGIFQAMKGLPVTIRLLDPPLHEFLPHEEKEQYEAGQFPGISIEQVRQRVSQLHEANPMLGHRGDRLAITYPEILEMQVTAIIEAAIECKNQGVKVLPEIMIPLAGTKKELDFCNHPGDGRPDHEREGHQGRLPVRHDDRGAPRAVTADEMAQTAEFFSFGTNDLTQMTFGYSRDDVNSFLPDYLRRKSWSATRSVARHRRRRQARPHGRRARPRPRPGLKCGICGEHGGDPKSVEFCHQVGLDYVSCSPFRVPIARPLAAAQAVIKQPWSADQSPPSSTAGRRRSGSNRTRPR